MNQMGYVRQIRDQVWKALGERNPDLKELETRGFISSGLLTSWTTKNKFTTNCLGLKTLPVSNVSPASRSFQLNILFVKTVCTYIYGHFTSSDWYSGDAHAARMRGSMYVRSLS